MRLAIARAMAISLWRDPGALAMTFALPPAVFVIFALVFATASGGDLTVNLVVADDWNSARSQQLVRQLERVETLRVDGRAVSGEDEVAALVRSGEADAGVVLKPPARAGEGGRAVMVGAPSRTLAVTLLEGELQRLAAGALAQAPPPGAWRLERVSASAAIAVPISVAYYAPGVAMLFLLLAAVQGALTVLEERESGLFDRLALGPGGVRTVIEGKFIFIALQGMVQVALIFAAAWIGFGVTFAERAAGWAVTTVLAAAAAAGLALGFVTACRTRRQALTLGNILVLVFSAVGGSMVPRFFMPVEMRALGWLTPNTWGIEAYASLLWRADTLEALWLPWAALLGAAVAGLAVADLQARRWR